MSWWVIGCDVTVTYELQNDEFGFSSKGGGGVSLWANRHCIRKTLTDKKELTIRKKTIKEKKETTHIED